MPAERRADTAESNRRSLAGLVTRGRTSPAWTLLFRILRLIAGRAQNVYATFGLFLLAGAAVAVVFTWGFVQIAGHVQSGATQAFDDMAMRFIGAHQTPSMQATMVEVTALGTTVLETMIVIIAGTLLSFHRHKHSAVLLAISTLGGVGLNNLLKAGFDRPRPHIFAWGTTVTSSSFPSGHAMSAAVVYGTVAYLVARLQGDHRSRMATLTFAALIILLVCVSRMYLGVHYPSDVLAGVTIGLAWAGFCMAILEMTQLYARRNAPELLESEQPAAAPGVHEPALPQAL
jgi:undecaprenyl-diphosphatase